MMKINLSIITINFNDFDLTCQCIESVRSNTKDICWEIIIINNHPQSKAGDVQKFNQLYGNNSQIKILPSENKGFGAANNLGARHARGKFLLFLNNDTLVVGNSLKKMVGYLQKNQAIAAIDPLLYFKKGKLQKRFFSSFQNLKSVVFRQNNEEKINLGQEFFPADMVTGAALMIRRELFERINGFDEKFFMYFEDEDLCRRLSNLGKKNGILTTAGIIHLGGKSLNQITRKKIYYQSQNYYWQKHYGYFMMFLMRFLRFPYVLWRKIKK